MSRLLDGAQGYLDCGGAYSKPTTGTGLTVGSWIYPTGWGEANFGFIFNFGGGAVGTLFFLDNSSHTRTLGGYVDFASADSWRSAPTDFITLNTWQFVAMVWDGGVNATNLKLYRGNPGSLPAEPGSYTDVQNGSGALSTPGNLLIGNRTAQDRTFDGRLARAFYYRGILSAAELALAMYRLAALAHEVALPLGWASPEPDLSGHVNNGTITGSIAVAGDPPVGRWAPGRLSRPPIEFTSAIVQAADLPYATELGHVLDLPYATELGHVLDLPYQTVQGVFNRLDLPFETIYGMRTFHELILPFETVPGSIRHALRLPYATAGAGIVAPHVASSRVEPTP